MLYGVYFKIHIKQTSDFAQGNKPNSYQTSEKKVPDPPHVMVINPDSQNQAFCLWNLESGIPLLVELWNQQFREFRVRNPESNLHLRK